MIRSSNARISETKLETSALGRTIINALRDLVQEWGGSYAYFAKNFTQNTWVDKDGNPLNESMEFEDVPLYVGVPQNYTMKDGLYVRDYASGNYVPVSEEHTRIFNTILVDITKDFFEGQVLEGNVFENGIVYALRNTGSHEALFVLKDNGLVPLLAHSSIDLESLLVENMTFEKVIEMSRMRLEKYRDFSNERVGVNVDGYTSTSCDFSNHCTVYADVNDTIETSGEQLYTIKYVFLGRFLDVNYENSVSGSRTYAYNVEAVPNGLHAAITKFPNGKPVDFYMERNYLRRAVIENLEMITDPITGEAHPYFTRWNEFAKREFRYMLYKGNRVFTTSVMKVALKDAFDVSEIKHYDNVAYIDFTESTLGNLKNLHPEVRENNFSVNRHDYAPNYTKPFYKTSADTEDKPLYMGCEIELNGGGNSNKNAAIILGALGDYKDVGYVMHDGSLDDGIELATHPATLSAHKDSNIFNYDRLFTLARVLGYDAYESGRAGLHVHVSRNFFTYPDTALHIMSTFVHNNWDDLLIFTRRMKESTYAEACKESTRRGADIQGIRELMKSLDIEGTVQAHKNAGKYSSINTRHSNTFEFRIFRGTLNETAFMGTLEFVDTLCRWAEKLSIVLEGVINADNISNAIGVINLFREATIDTLVETTTHEAFREYANNVEKYMTDMSTKEIT